MAAFPTSACLSASTSKRSTRTGCAPARRKRSSFIGVRLIAETVYPALTNLGTRDVPSTPVAPVTKMFIIVLLFISLLFFERSLSKRFQKGDKRVHENVTTA